MENEGRIAVIGFRGVPHVIGGIETHCEHLYPALAEAAPDLDITMIARRRYVRASNDRLGKVRLVALPAPKQGSIETLVHTPLAIVYARWRLQAAIVHLHGIGPGFFAPLARILGMHVIVTHHAADFERPKWGRVGRRFLRLGELLMARFADRVICVSDTVRREFLSRHGGAIGRTVTIQHGLDLQASVDGLDFLVDQRLVSGGYLLAVGRLEPTKRFEDLIAAHALNPAALPLVIVGSSIGNADYEAELRDLAGDGVGSSVRFLGFRTGDELSALYTHAAVLLHPSEMEGFGLVVLEALAFGAPAIVSDIPVHREFGLPANHYFPVGDHAAIGSIMAETQVRTAPWSQAAAIAARYTSASAVEAHAMVFRQFMNASNTAQ
ncbi:MAG: glycosyltransferase [Oxalobacteraceae bacterium]|nr:MAG: glycosyltransferase [Oxalobacteraceae bacterium]